MPVTEQDITAKKSEILTKNKSVQQAQLAVVIARNALQMAQAELSVLQATKQLEEEGNQE